MPQRQIEFLIRKTHIVAGVLRVPQLWQSERGPKDSGYGTTQRVPGVPATLAEQVVGGEGLSETFELGFGKDFQHLLGQLEIVARGDF